MTPKVDAVLIAGPTASGKSGAALALAEAVDGVVVNADSMQVYRQPRILTARPSDEDMARAPHRLYGHVDADEVYSAGRYQCDAANALAQARAVGRLPIFTGGTGLYLAALTEGLAEIPAVPAAIRSRARARLVEIGVGALHAELAARDPRGAALLRPTDPQRVLRAFEVFEATGRPLSDWQRRMGKSVLDGLHIARFVLDLPRPELRARIEMRFVAMMDAGAAAEAASLTGIASSLPAAKILGLRELWAAQSGAMTQAEAVAAAVTATRQFAKRQTTWFRHRMADWTWLPAQDFRNIIPAMMLEVA